MKALIVDDSAVMRLMLHRRLQELGFDPTPIASGEEALEAIAGPGGLTPDLFVLDWYMPGMHGADLVRAVRDKGPFMAAKILIVSAETDLTQMQEVLSPGLTECLSKPVTTEHLAEKLKSLGF